LITTYVVTPANLTSVGGPSDGYIWDCYLQEVDVETNTLLFEWRASDHHSVDEAFFAVGNSGTENNPFDFYHINSIDKDEYGNYLVSSRYLKALTYINGTDGEVLWVLGGKRNSFHDLSHGKATDFAFQHEARWYSDFKTISIFDNAANNVQIVGPQSRGLYLSLDTEKMTVEVIRSFTNPHKYISQSQGSMEILDSGKVVVGYGFNSAFTEFASNGTILCDVRFGWWSPIQNGDVQSYRVAKKAWVGSPPTRPSIGIEGLSAYASWNGATEVASWKLEGSQSDTDGSSFVTINQTAKKGFETRLEIHTGKYPYLRLAAVDTKGHILKYSETVAPSRQLV